MNLSDQVCSLQLAKRLKELNVKQDSLFYWENCTDHCEEFVISSKEYHDLVTGEWTDCHLLENQENYSAFTMAELIFILPSTINTKQNEPFNFYRLRITKSFFIEQDKNDKEVLVKEDTYIANYFCDTTECAGEDAWLSRHLANNTGDTNPANTLAKMYIYLKENGLI